MSDRILRDRDRIDYRVLHETGRIENLVSDSDSDFLSDEGAQLEPPLNQSSVLLESKLSDESENKTVLSRSPTSSLCLQLSAAWNLTEMTEPVVAKLAAELETLLFQWGELQENEDELDECSLSEASKMSDELKELRLNMVKKKKELAFLVKNNAAFDYNTRIDDACISSKLMLKAIKTRISKLEKEKDHLHNQKVVDAEQRDRLTNLSKIQAFERSLKEIKNMFETLSEAYSAPAESLSRSQILKRNEDKAYLSIEFNKFRDRVDRLNCQVDFVFDQKEAELDEAARMLASLETNKRTYENTVYHDLVANDLTDDKLKLAESTKIEIGKFSGVMGTGDDFYTFKTKFLKAYGNHPKSNILEYLKNNHLTGKAKECVGSLDVIESIWTRLQDNFGNTEVMLKHHFKKMNEMGEMHKLKSYTAKKFYLQNLINSMQDVSDLAEAHDLKGEIDYGPQLPTIVSLLENKIQAGWFKIIAQENTHKTHRWTRMIVFLESQLSIMQVRALETETSPQSLTSESKKSVHDSYKSLSGKSTKGPTLVGMVHDCCSLCEEKHPNADQDVFHCKKFLLMSPKQRSDFLRKKKICLQCLDSKTKWNDPEHACSEDWICAHESHGKYEKKLHFFVCEHHACTEGNLELFEKFKRDVLKEDWQQRLTQRKSCYISNRTLLEKNRQEVPKIEQTNNKESENELPDATSFGPPVFILQPVPLNNHVFNFMYDSGCESFVCRKKAVDYLPDEWKENIKKGPLVLNGVGCNQVTSPYGCFQVQLPIHDGRLAKFSGVCLDVVTGAMPPYPVREVRKSIVEAFEAQGGKGSDLPKLPTLVGGETDFLLGIQYNFYLPREMFVLPTGLAIYQSMFKGLDGTRGCIGGPHELFAQCERQFMEHNTASSFRVYLSQQLKLYSSGYRICIDSDALKVHNSLLPHSLAVVREDDVHQLPEVLLGSSKLNDSDEAGSNVSYRCQKCRGCSDCRNGDKIEEISLKEEREQFLIDQSVSVDFQNKETIASLPFTADPLQKLESNKKNAMKIYKQQVKKLNKNPSAKEEVLRAEMRLQADGHVEWIKNLSKEEVDLLNKYSAKYYMPWRFVYNENSVSTPVRIVFDASSISESGHSLNDILAKGINSLNSLLQILIRFRCMPVAIHTDVKRMYNVVKLNPVHWTYQRYLFHPQLDVSLEPEEKVIKTLIYGVRSSGNQAQCGLRDTAEKQKDKFPQAANAILRDTYVDDCATGAMCLEEAHQLSSDIDEMLARGGFSTKGFTLSGLPPPSSLTKDSESVNVLGMNWISEDDMFRLSIGELNFGKRYRGKKSVDVDSWKVPDRLTRSICLGKVAEVFDIAGFVTPIVAGFKLDINDLVNLRCDWDDPIPDSFREVWIDNFQLMQELGSLKYSRAVIPENAVDLNAELICAGDASARMTCGAVYIRFKLKEGSYSCQLILGKSKIVPNGMSLPRAEMYAAVLNVHMMEIVKRALIGRCSNTLLITDSEIALHWLSSQTKQLKPWVRNRAIEIGRFSKPEDWYHVDSKLNPADIGTRKGATIEDVGPLSEWINGKPWMTLSFSDMKKSVLKSLQDVKYKNDQMMEIKKEAVGSVVDLCRSDFHLILNNSSKMGTLKYFIADQFERTDTSTNVKRRLSLSKYIIDPNKFSFNKVVRVMAYIIKASKSWLSKIRRNLVRFSYVLDPSVDSTSTLDSVLKKHGSTPDMEPDIFVLSDSEVQYALDYFFQKATIEVKSFLHPNQYKNLSFERNEILYCKSRVRPGSVNFRCDMTDAMIDLNSHSFIVPLVEKYSPLAYSIINQVHWYHRTAKHRGVETTIRFIMPIAHIFGVRELVKRFRKECVRCRFLLMHTVDVEMAPASKNQLVVAPPYYVTQVDLCGPFNSFSMHNKRTKLKIWIATFVCSTTGMTNLKVAEGYDTTQFLLAFSRFVCESGYPKLLLVDSGSQMLNACDNMTINMVDLKYKLNSQFGIEFKTCPVGGHNYHGRVERKIKTVQESLCKTVQDARLSSLQWETLCAEISNSINNCPVAIGNETQDLEDIDLITPNRLKLGRNNDRSPIGTLDVTDRIDRILKMNTNIFNAWWEAWLVSALPKVIPQPKWFKNDTCIKVGDIVTFKKTEGSIAGIYRIGMVEDVHLSTDGLIRSVTIRYRNANEDFDRTTVRAVRSLVIIHRVDELSIMEELGKASLIPTSEKVDN